MRADVYLHGEDSLLDRLEHGYRTFEEFVFLIGSGVTCPVGNFGGVLGVNAVIDLIRKEFSNPTSHQVLEQLDAEKIKNPAAEYQNAFLHLSSRRGQDFVNRVIRRAVLSARVPNDPLSHEAQRLSVEPHIKPDDCHELCEMLEKDVQHWQFRPGLGALGKILTEFQSGFGNVVLTTNFDPLIKVSVRLAGGMTETWPLHGDGPQSWPTTDSAVCRILHLHGFWAGDTLHAKAVLARERPNLEIELAKILRRRVLVVLGYSGWDDAFARALLRVTRDADPQHDVLWTLFPSSDEEVFAHHQGLFDRLNEGSGSNRILFFKGIDADSFLPALLKMLRSVRDNVTVETAPVQLGDSTEGTFPPPSADATTAPPEAAAGELAPQPDAAPQPSGGADFLTLLRERCWSVTQVDLIPENEREFVQEPNFLLFEREGSVVMTIAPRSESIDVYKLQKTNEPQVKCELLPLERIEALGFAGGKVHPMFFDPRGKIKRIYWDASLLVQAILFPGSKLALPLYKADGTEQKVLAPINTVLELLEEWHGRDKIIFANIVSRDRTGADNPVFEKLLAGQPFITRFAPTPSSLLHLGNVRTALATYLMSLRDNERSHFYLRFDNTDHKRCPHGLVSKIKDELRWLGLRWDEAQDAFEQSSDDANKRYKNLLKVLELAEFTEQDADGTVTLKDLPATKYYCVYYDRRDGAVVMHQPPPTKKGAKFGQSDLKDPALLVTKLRGGQDPVSKHLWEQFTPQSREQLKTCGGTSPMTKLHRGILADELNRLLEGPSLYGEKRFAHVKLTNKTRRLIEDNLQNEDLRLLNRLLLEEAYPHEIGRKPKRPKRIDLFRGDDFNAFYRFAGLIDDIRSFSDKEHLTCVLRDNRQAELTRVQAHIRFALELARQKLSTNRAAQDMFRESGLNPQKSIPLPLYFHLPVVTDNGEAAPPLVKEDGEVVPRYTVLRKRKKSEGDTLNKFSLKHLRYERSMLPESIVAYLVSTIIPRRAANESWKSHLGSIAFVFSQLGVHGGLQFFSRSFTLDDLVRSQKPIRCDLRQVQFAEQIIVEKIPFWNLNRKLKKVPDNDKDEYVPLDLDRELVERIARHSSSFASFSQILSVVRWPKTCQPLSTAAERFFKEVCAEVTRDAQVVERIRAEIDLRREELGRLPEADLREGRKLELWRLLADLRHALAGAESSPKIGPLMMVLGDTEVAHRLRAADKIGRER